MLPIEADPVFAAAPCPACGGALVAGARICTRCGIDPATGRPITEAQARIDKALHTASSFMPACAGVRFAL